MRALWMVVAVLAIGCQAESGSGNDAGGSQPPDSDAAAGQPDTDGEAPDPDAAAGDPDSAAAGEDSGHDDPDAAEQETDGAEETPDAAEEGPDGAEGGPDGAEEGPDGAEDLEGECTGEADQAALLEHEAQLEMTITNCVFGCLGQPPTCVSTCLIDAVGFSEGCAGCFSDTVTCTLAQCAAVCLDAASAACRDCQAMHCDDDFEDCAGISPTR